jgi:carboxypeptidase T
MKNAINFLLLISIVTLFSIHSIAQTYSKIKIYTDEKGLAELAQLGVGIDHGTYKKNTFFISDFSSNDILKIKNAGFQYDVLIPDVTRYFLEENKRATLETRSQTRENCSGGTVNHQSTVVTPSNFHLGSMGGYFTYEEMLAELDEMAAAYPELISAKAPISTFTTHENRPIHHVKISNNPTTDDGDPYVLYSAIHHAREPGSLSQLIYFMWYVLENYGTNPEITYLVDNTQMLFVPILNPDGYVQNQTSNPNGGGMWRKNKRNNGGGDFGVDNNRNYSYGWNTTGVSDDPSSDVYPGPSAFSEPENQAMKWLNETYTIRLAFNAHTYGNMLLFPVGTTNEEFADHHDYFTDISGHMCSHNNYNFQKSSGLYPASGDSDDYMYKVDIGIGAKDTVFAMTPEIGESFWPVSTRIEPIAKDNVFPNLVLAHLAHQYALVLETDASSIDITVGNFNHYIKRLGLIDGNIVVSINPITGISSVGNGVTYALEIRETATGSISYELENGINFGDPIVYELLTNNGGWIRRDTIRKTFGTPTTQFIDNATSSSNWIGDWATTTETYVSSPQSFTDSPFSNYPSDAFLTYRLAENVDLSDATNAMVRFYAKWDIEADWDYAAFEVSTNGGSSWQQLCGNYTNAGVAQIGWDGQNQGIQPVDEPIYDGLQADWVLEEIDLSDYLGSTISLRFILHSDGAEERDGFYFDDFQLLYNESESANIKENSNNIFALFPNPASSTVRLDFGQQIATGTIQVFDLMGKLISTTHLNGTSHLVDLSIEQYDQGIYSVVYVSDEQITSTKRLVIVR